MTLNVVITKLKNVEKMRGTVMMIVNVNLVLFAAIIIVPLAVKVISVEELIVAQNVRTLRLKLELIVTNQNDNN